MLENISDMTQTVKKRPKLIIIILRVTAVKLTCSQKSVEDAHVEDLYFLFRVISLSLHPTLINLSQLYGF